MNEDELLRENDICEPMCSVYQLIITDEVRQSGTFSVCNNPIILERVLANKERMLKACVINTDSNIINPTKIKTTSFGSAVKVGDIWVVNNKAQITLI